MKKFAKIWLSVILLLVLSCSLGLLAACAPQTADPEEFVGQQGNTVRVLLDSTYGLGDRGGGNVIDYRLKPGSLIPEPGVTDNTKAPTAENFVFLGYYEGEVVNGEVVYGDKWDFSKKVSQDMTLYGKWEKQFTIRIRFMLDGALQSETDCEIVSIYNNAPSVNSVKEPTWLGHTFVEIYSDQNRENVFTVDAAHPFVHGCTADNPQVDLYADFIDGNWTLVRSADDLRTINAGSRLYLMDDVDFAKYSGENGKKNSLNTDDTHLYTNMTINRGTFTGTIEGNGHVIKNLDFLAEGTRNTSASSYNFGLFTAMRGATVRNVTFENCSVTGVIARQSAEYFYAFLAGRAENCTFENVTLKNCTVNPMQVKILGMTNADQIAAELAKVEQAVFVAEGSTFEPTIEA